MMISKRKQTAQNTSKPTCVGPAVGKMHGYLSMRQ